MAFEKSIDTNAGVPAVYWKIVRVKLDKKNNSYYVKIEGYATNSATNAIDFKEYKFDYLGSHIGDKDVETYLYEKLKLHPDWVDALDV